jgi:hypothetical protein
VTGAGPKYDPLAIFTLRAVRSFLREGRFGRAVGVFGLLYVLGALFAGNMIGFGNFGGGYTIWVLLSSPTGVQPWNYPGLFVVAPWGVIQLPFFATFTMIVVGVGVGFGMAVAALLTWRLLRPSAAERARSQAVGAVTGLTPAMLSLVTLGACCTSTAAATAGIGLVAAASATTVANLLANNWFLGVFQIAIVWVSLLAQELLLTVYGGLYGTRGGPPQRIRHPALVRWLEVGALRVALLVGGLLLALSTLQAWTATDPYTASALTWTGWLGQRALIGLVTIAFALFPEALTGLFARAQRSGFGRVGVGIVAVGAASLLIAYPASWTAAGWNGLVGLVLSASSGTTPMWATAFRAAVELTAPALTVIALSAVPSRLGAWVSEGLAHPEGGPVGGRSAETAGDLGGGAPRPGPESS